MVFAAYSGVALRQYPQLFAMSDRGAKRGGSLKRWYAERASLSPLYVPPRASLAYWGGEAQDLVKLPQAIYSWNPALVLQTVGDTPTPEQQAPKNP